MPATDFQPDNKNPRHFRPIVRKIAFSNTAHRLNSLDILRQFQDLPQLLLLESSAEGKTPTGSTGRYSFLMADPFATFCVEPGTSDPLNKLRAASRQFRAETLPELPPFQGGFAGLLSYELNRSFEKLPAPLINEFPLPAIQMNAYDVVIAWDHQTDDCWIVSQGFPEVDPEQRRKRAEQRADFFEERLGQTPPPLDSSTFKTEAPDWIPQQVRNPISGHALASNFTKDEYIAAVQKAIDYIHAGDIFQVNLAQQLYSRAMNTAPMLYFMTHTHNPAPFSCYFDLGETQLISSSPERLVSVKDGWVETRPIKGTCRRTGHPEVDLDLACALKRSEKDRAENIMIVDLMRNDLSRVCADDSIDVRQLCGLESYESVIHLVSSVIGKLRPDCDVFDLLESVFPGGSITGAPKVRAMEIIAEIEPAARNAYCGSVGYIGFDGTADFNILIRTMTQQKGWLQIPVGGGITAKSIPEQEYEETWTKAIGMLGALS